MPQIPPHGPDIWTIIFPLEKSTKNSEASKSDPPSFNRRDTEVHMD